MRLFSAAIAGATVGELHDQQALTPTTKGDLLGVYARVFWAVVLFDQPHAAVAGVRDCQSIALQWPDPCYRR
ncbi:hypothetical protein BA177_10485 [Woeseia oceani]|uniref:Uncharacterized protein n=1 Tax=Woeseia oceani TaxID=1548547 RepID=A0A193LGD4_9GAMM|nr:hypothetical protein BA177_10485 [Woeseia oceani]